MKVILTINLNIESNSEKECEKILEEMDYHFSHISVQESIGKQLNEIDSIKDYEIVNWNIEHT